VSIGGKTRVVEFEPDRELRDSEQISFTEPGGIRAFIEREVHPYTPMAWVDETTVKRGYEINFNRHFFRPRALRGLDEIASDILTVEKDTEQLLAEIAGQGIK